MLQLPPLSLYVHIPWCVRKCPYCDFNSHEAGQTIPEQDYVRALIEDLKADLAWVQGRKLHSIFFGGGTPSLFSGQAIGDILKAAEKLIGFETDIEITLEANPGTFEQQKFSDFYSAGVNRLSIGIQSFNNQHLQRLGRIHDGEQAIKAIATAQLAGFNNFNIDLMHGLPEQSLEQAQADIQQAIDSGAQHISWYQLTIEPNTAFYSKPPPLPNDDRLADIQQGGMNLLHEHQFGQYEVSAFALHGQTSRHNINYWEFGDYLGIGAGAHGKITLPEQDSVIRTSKTRQPDHYLAREGSLLVQNSAISRDEMALEFMMNGLRLKNGVATEYFIPRTGLDKLSVATQVADLQRKGLMEPDSDRYKTTHLGYQFLNTVLQSF
ncbi:radical SAM family heme chaperone HemW [Porticoccaceae bacterium]|jgi:putative oxygen-independent coproporphyrinogen III oxidase|nr:radical SAM family heme chaperone HemW [Porticoccaceae bacterium]MDB9843128.1 radical SAM family heme chaperone HemW [Porticoccaceae bacterium]CAI8279878.1 MAG: Oxygen-independent coproporphyrinogen-III oxidase-like protein [SAR92 bacterium MED-G29]|tara:strand:+ start:7604 stop:8740 length:1137 start_codon:yes stop_codon:yes gene_type:complete